jgi:predicted transcriptional regulator
MAMTSVRIPDDLMVRLQKTAEQRRRSKSWLINDAVREYLEREEIRARRLAETRQALAEVDKWQLIEGDEVLDWLDSWGTEDEKAPPK